MRLPKHGSVRGSWFGLHVCVCFCPKFYSSATLQSTRVRPCGARCHRSPMHVLTNRRAATSERDEQESGAVMEVATAHVEKGEGPPRACCHSQTAGRHVPDYQGQRVRVRGGVRAALGSTRVRGVGAAAGVGRIPRSKGLSPHASLAESLPHIVSRSSPGSGSPCSMRPVLSGLSGEQQNDFDAILGRRLHLCFLVLRNQSIVACKTSFVRWCAKTWQATPQVRKGHTDNLWPVIAQCLACLYPVDIHVELLCLSSDRITTRWPGLDPGDKVTNAVVERPPVQRPMCYGLKLVASRICACNDSGLAPAVQRNVLLGFSRQQRLHQVRLLNHTSA